MAYGHTPYMEVIPQPPPTHTHTHPRARAHRRRSRAPVYLFIDLLPVYLHIYLLPVYLLPVKYLLIYLLIYFNLMAYGHTPFSHVVGILSERQCQNRVVDQ